VDQAPKVVKSFEIPKPRPAGIPKTYLLGEICDLPVVEHIAVPVVAWVLRIGQEKEGVESRQQGNCPHGGQGPPRQRLRSDVSSGEP